MPLLAKPRFVVTTHGDYTIHDPAYPSGTTTCRPRTGVRSRLEDILGPTGPGLCTILDMDFPEFTF